MTIEDTSVASDISNDIVRQAIAWRIKLESRQDSACDQLACRQWRDKNPQHEIVWRRLDDMQSSITLVSQQSPKLAKSILLEVDRERRQVSRREALRTIAGSTLGVAALGILGQQQGIIELARADYSSFSQPSEYTLNDSSHVWLNAHSNIKVDFDSVIRGVTLLRGEMLLTTAQERRPMQVSTKDVVITGAEATFWLRQTQHFSLLQVNHGSVDVKSPHTGQEITATSGQLYRLDNFSIQPLDHRIFDYSSWVDGVFSVWNMPLNRFIDELSRYHLGVLQCAPQLNDNLISGVYQLSNIDLVMKTIALSLQSSVRSIGPWWIEIKPSLQ